MHEARALVLKSEGTHQWETPETETEPKYMYKEH